MIRGSKFKPIKTKESKIMISKFKLSKSQRRMSQRYFLVCSWWIRKPLKMEVMPAQTWALWRSSGGAVITKLFWQRKRALVLFWAFQFIQYMIIKMLVLARIVLKAAICTVLLSASIARAKVSVNKWLIFCWWIIRIMRYHWMWEQIACMQLSSISVWASKSSAFTCLSQIRLSLLKWSQSLIDREIKSHPTMK